MQSYSLGCALAQSSQPEEVVIVDSRLWAAGVLGLGIYCDVVHGSSEGVNMSLRSLLPPDDNLRRLWTNVLPLLCTI